MLLIISQSLAADDPFRIVAGAGESGMGMTCIMKPGFWSSFHNQALLAYNNTMSAGINFENRFNIKELCTGTAGIIIPAGNSSLGFAYSHFGYPDFTRHSVAAACGLAIAEWAAAGVQIDYYSEKTTGEHDDFQFITCEVGFTVKSSGNTTMGIHVFNPVPNSFRKSAMPSVLAAGIGAELSRVLFVGAEAEMSSGEKPGFRAGFEYEMAKKLWLRGGFGTEHASFCFGLGYLVKSAKLDLAFATHERLGITSSASIIFKIK